MNDPLTVCAGPASARLGTEVCEILRVQTQIEIRESLRGRDVFLLQSTSPPVEQHLMELLLLADACRRAGARRLTGVIPYFGYARHAG